MTIHSKLIHDDREYIIEYNDADSFDRLPKEKISQVYGICFCNKKLLIGRRAKSGEWGHLGGSVEHGESLEETLLREIQEESNMQVLSFHPIGYQTATDPNGETIYQVRYACTVKPLGYFTHDPALNEHGGIDAIKLISPSEYKQYAHWGEIGDHIMERAVGILTKLENE